MPGSSGASAKPFLLKLKPSRALVAWWALLHLVLALALLLASGHAAIRAALGLALVLHFWRRFPVRSALLLVSPGGRFGLPAEGRFDLGLTRETRLGSFWVELVFDDRPRAALLLLRDQFTDSGWRALRVALREWI